MPDATPIPSNDRPASAGVSATLGEFVARHIGPDDAAVAHMLEAIGH